MAHEGNERSASERPAGAGRIVRRGVGRRVRCVLGGSARPRPLPPAPSGAPRAYEAAEDGGWFVADEPAFAPAAPRAEPGPMPDVDVAMDELLAAVSTTWGFSELRPAQEEAMRASLAARDVLVIMPTGGGKSLCYQAPALIRPGLTLVISPLIALMKDQLDGLLANGVRAAMLSSALEADERSAVRGALARGELDLLFVSPERLAAEGFIDELARSGLTSIAVDEAHCISHWGHDFRPDYRAIGTLRARRPTSRSSPSRRRHPAGPRTSRRPRLAIRCEWSATSTGRT